MEYGDRGTFMMLLNKALKQDTRNTISEILFSFLRPSLYKNGSFFFASDEEICANIENFLNIDMEDDILTDEEFVLWVNTRNYGE